MNAAEILAATATHLDFIKSAVAKVARDFTSHDQEDMVQDACMKLIYNTSISDDNDFLRLAPIVANNCMIDWIRRNRAKKRDTRKNVDIDLGFNKLDEFLVASGSTPSSHFSKAERAAAVREAMNQLDEESRYVVYAAFFEGLTLAQIGLETGRAHNTVHDRLCRSYTRIRDILTAMGHTNE